jgi:tRNA A-37 threonylcarbamoyl transferase component Bud32
MHQLAYNISKQYPQLNLRVPQIIEYQPDERVLVMEAILNPDSTTYSMALSVSDMFGEDLQQVPPSIIDTIRSMVRGLYLHGIEYVDITGYNFLYVNEQTIYIIDFECATTTCIGTTTTSGRDHNYRSPDPYVAEFIGFGPVECWNSKFL